MLDSLRNRRTFLFWLFPLAVWAMATGFHGFQLGKYSDDWSQSLIDPDTQHADAAFHPWVRWAFFFRPLYFIVVWAINTAFWEHDGARHLIASLAHLGVGVCLYRLLRRIGLNRPASILPVAVHLACPTHYEAVLWVAAIGIPIGTALYLLAAERVVHFARQIPDGRPWGCLAAIATLIFAAACFHEQPAAGAAGLPALYLACCLPDQRMWVRVRRAMLTGMFAGGACMLYMALITLTAPAGRRGSMASLVKGTDAPQRAASLLHEIGRWLWGDHARDAAIDAAGRGWHIVESSPVSIAFALLLLGGLAAWLAAFPGAWSRTQGHWTVRRTPWLVVFALVMSIASLLPVAITAGNGIYSRYFYVLTLGIPIIAACVLDPISGLRMPRAMRIALPSAIALAAAALGVWGALAMVSWQSDFAARAAMDRDIGEQMRSLVPDPHRDAVIVPISIAPSRAPARTTDRTIPGVLERPFAGWAFVQQLYGRSDLSATHCRAGEPAPIRITGEGLAYVYPGGGPHGIADQWGRAARSNVVPWERAVPIDIDADGRVHLLLRAEVEQRLGNRR